MIVDNLDILYEYNVVPPEVLEFIDKLTVNAMDGEYYITDTITAKIESYTRKDQFEATLESHRKFVDLQFLIDGVERIDYANIDGLVPYTKYDPDKDIIFYKKPKTEIGSVYLNGRNFAIFFPQDAHAPQITTLALQNNVKKCVIKIAVEFNQ
ncbi:YhcH/YjgK/YiaL family protein [bacterium]|nr:YhcH/YjgK/YiaL family protein [bacterium]